MKPILVCLVALGVPIQLGAQGAEPLRKTDLIRLLSSPVIRKGEVADLIRRNCLSFRPTERDWSDLRSLGADADVMSSIGGCAARTSPLSRPTIQPVSTAPPSGAPPAASAPLTAVPVASRVSAVVGSDALVRVAARRGDAPQPGAALVLRGSSLIPGGAARDVQAVTDDSGIAVFPVPAGRQPGTYSLELASGAGAALPSRPTVEVVVRAGRPARADVRPGQIVLGGAQEGPFAVQVDLRDSLHNPVPSEPLELRPERADMGIAVDSGSTDSLGRATFVIEAAAVRRPGQVGLHVRGERLGSIEVVFAGPVSSAGSGFVSPGTRRGVARTLLAAPVVFQARSVSGRPLPGRMVRFGAHNAQIAPDSVLTDSAGQARVEVTLGSRAGSAVVTASMDSVQKAETLHVDPGPPVELILERDGTRVDGGRIIVELGIPFTITVRARDGYGNPVRTVNLARALQDMVTRFNARRQLLMALGVETDSLSTGLTFKPTGLGSTDLTVSVGLSASVAVEVVSASK